MRLIAMLIMGLIVAATPLAAAEVKSMQEIYQAGPNKLADIPSRMQLENPVELQVLFNLSHPANSPEADAFLKDYIKFLMSLPDTMTVRLSRVVAPAKYDYATRLTFANWHDYQVYEKSPAFRKYYYDVWKPNVPDAQELFTIVDVESKSRH